MAKNERLLSEMAQGRILRLMELAKARTLKVGSTDALARRYIRIASDIKSHYGIRSANSIKSQFCKTCNSIIVPGFNATVRVFGHGKYRLIVCSRCGSENRIFFK